LIQTKEKLAGKILNPQAKKDSKNNTPLFSIPVTSPTRTGGEAPWIDEKLDY
jgi:hypothetical protein